MSEKATRYFTYLDPKSEGSVAAFGKQTIIHEQDVDRNLYGTTIVELIFPVKKELKNSFPLDLYPNTDKTMHSNFEDTNTAFSRLWKEVNRASKLLTQSALISTLKNPKLEVRYEDIQIVSEEMLDDSLEDRMTGIVQRDVNYLRKGDIVSLLFLQDDNLRWFVRYDPNNHGTSLKEKLRKFFMRIFNKRKYESRYVFSDNRTMSLSFEDIRVINSPVEEGTAR